MLAAFPVFLAAASGLTAAVVAKEHRQLDANNTDPQSGSKRTRRYKPPSKWGRVTTSSKYGPNVYNPPSNAPPRRQPRAPPRRHSPIEDAEIPHSSNHTSNTGYSGYMAYRRKRFRPRRRRRVRRRRFRHRGRSRLFNANRNVAMPTKYRMKHYYEIADYFNINQLFPQTPTPTSKQYPGEWAVIPNCQATLKCTSMHDPHKPRAPIATGSYTSGHTPTWFDTMAGLYERYKVNSVYVVFDLHDGRLPTFAPVQDGYSSTVKNYIFNNSNAPHYAHTYHNAPWTLCCYPEVQGSGSGDTAIDAHWHLRPGSKSRTVLPSGRTRLTYKLNPHRVSGSKNSWSNTDIIVESPSSGDISDTSKSVYLRFGYTTWELPPGLGDTQLPNVAQYRLRVWYDVTWAHPKETAFDA